MDWTVAGGCAAALVAAAIGYPCSNLRGHYFSIATIAFAEIVRIVFNNWKMVGAAEGLSLPMDHPSFAHFLFNTSKLPYYYIMLAFLLISMAVCYFVATSKMGYYFRAIKESHRVAEVMGVNVVWYRLMAVMISAFLSAMAGTFYAQYILYHRSRQRHASGYLRPDRPYLNAGRGGKRHGPGARRGYTDTRIGIHAHRPRCTREPAWTC